MPLLFRAYWISENGSPLFLASIGASPGNATSFSAQAFRAASPGKACLPQTLCANVIGQRRRVDQPGHSDVTLTASARSRRSRRRRPPLARAALSTSPPAARNH